jgi:carbonic anhydrase
MSATGSNTHALPSKSSGPAAVDELDQVTEQNVLLQLQHLSTHPTVAAGIRSNEITLHGWVYDIESGQVNAWDQATDTFLPIEERYASLLSASPTAA